MGRYLCVVDEFLAGLIGRRFAQRSLFLLLACISVEKAYANGDGLNCPTCSIAQPNTSVTVMQNCWPAINDAEKNTAECPCENNGSLGEVCKTIKGNQPASNIDVKTALTFFSGIFWATAISSMRTFKIFHIWVGSLVLTVGRLLLGVLILNVLPMLILGLNLKYFPGHYVAEEMIVAAGIASMPMFSIVYFLPAILQFGLGRLLYPTIGTLPTDRNLSYLQTQRSNADSLWKIEAEKEDVNPDCGWRSLLIGFLYVLLPVLWIYG